MAYNATRSVGPALIGQAGKKKPLYLANTASSVYDAEIELSELMERGEGVTRWRRWLRHCAISQKVAGST